MFQSLEDICKVCEKEEIAFWQVIIEDDMRERKVSREESFHKMVTTWEAMVAAAKGYQKNLKSSSGLTGGDGAKMEEYLKQRTPLCGDFVGKAIIGALQMGESNACMQRIVAAPTAGASGVMPAVLVPYYEQINKNEAKIVEAMYVAAGIGQVIALRASISGAQGGCQAEIGSASAMTAGALVYLEGGSHIQIIHGAAMALKNLLGLVCDPVAGLVEVPCVKRNVIGAVNAITSAEMSLAGIISKIPPDQVIDAMKEIGDKMDSTLKETGKGGLAATPAGKAAEERLYRNTI